MDLYRVYSHVVVSHCTKHQKVPRCRQKRMVSIDSLIRNIFTVCRRGKWKQSIWAESERRIGFLERILPILVLNIMRYEELQEESGKIIDNAIKQIGIVLNKVENLDSIIKENKIREFKIEWKVIFRHQ